MKKFVITGIIIVVLIVIIVFFLLSNLNSFVAKAIEKNGSKVTQTSVRVSGVDISLRDGRGSIKRALTDSMRARRFRSMISSSKSMSRASAKTPSSLRKFAFKPPSSTPR
jgi:succinate dehydrogenase hydrophobic anchor subunit